MTCVVIRSLCFFNNMWKRLEYQLNVPYKSQKALKLHKIFCLFFLFYHRFKWNDLNQSILTRNSWTFIQIFCTYTISLNANNFITPVPVYKMKYLLKCQYCNCQLVILLTLMAYTHQMLKTYNYHVSVSWIKNMFYDYVSSEQTSYFMEFKCNFHFMPVHTFKLMAF